MAATAVDTLAGEELLTLAAAAREFPSRSASHVNGSTIWRWTETGVKTRNGRVRLARVRYGSLYYTSRQAIDRFLRALNEPAATRPAPSPAFQTPKQRQRAERQATHRAKRVDKKLAEIGV
jgi:hypothetical protein